MGPRVGQRHDTRRGDRLAIDGRQGYPRIVHHPARHHIGHCRLRWWRRGSQLGKFPGQLGFPRQARCAGMHPHLV
jgi:hypothetical protein